MHLILVFTQRMQVAGESRELGVEEERNLKERAGKGKSKTDGKEGRKQVRDGWRQRRERESKQEMGGDRLKRERASERWVETEAGEREREQT